MDNARKYKEALERAKELCYVADTFTITIHDICTIFPELKESEDEKIRKEIIRIFKGETRYTSKEDTDKYIAWLEKQGEQTHAELSQQEVTKTSGQEPPDKVEPKDAHPDIDVRTMAAWQSGYNEGIDRACEWLDYHLTFNVAEWDEGVTTQRVIDKFRKAMKGGED